MDFNFFNINNERGFKYSKKWLNKHKPEFLSDMMVFIVENNINPDDHKFKELLWLYINDTKSPPKCECGKTSSFISVPVGYGKYCSNKCSSRSSETLDKRKITNTEKYGVDFYTQTDDYKEKTNKTNLEKYGVEWVSQSKMVKNKIKESMNNKYGSNSFLGCDEGKLLIKKIKKEKYGTETYNNPDKIKSTLLKKYENKECLDEFLNKQKNTNLIRYGEEYANRNEEIKQKNIDETKKSVIEKYGVDNVFELVPIQKKIKNKNINNFHQTYPEYDFIGYDDVSKTHTISCDKCGSFDITANLLYTRTKFGDEVCTNCNKIHKHYSLSEKELTDFICDQLPNHEILINDTSLLKRKEIDVYVPQKNIAIEFDGLYWHSELYKHQNYHLEKTNECGELGVSLIHVFEDEWVHKKDIVKSILKNKLKLTDTKIYARKCVIKHVNNGDVEKFLDSNHIQGYVKSSIKLGLYYNGNLVSLMNFTKNKNHGEYQLVRFCNKLNTSVIGGASKLLTHFIKNYDVTKIVSFSDKRWSNGGLYEKLGFDYVVDVKPSYWYIQQTTRFHKFNFRKNRKKMDGLDKTKTEHELMLDKKIYRIYDCGLKKWELNVNKNN